MLIDNRQFAVLVLCGVGDGGGGGGVDDDDCFQWISTFTNNSRITFFHERAHHAQIHYELVFSQSIKT